MTDFRVVAMDMDGTLTQHKTPLQKENREVLDQLGEHYHLIIVGAGSCQRIHNQLEGYPIDIIGCYGMQMVEYRKDTDSLKLIEDNKVALPDRDMIIEKAAGIRKKYGYEQFEGDSVEFHSSGMMTFALLGTKAEIGQKLAFDPQRILRSPMYADVCAAFPDYTVFIGGSSSFDIVPLPYTKLYAIDRFCERYGYNHSEIIYFGDDYGTGGNDAQVFNSDIRFVTMKEYGDFAHMTRFLLL